MSDQSHLNVLIIDDSPEDRAAYAHWLRRDSQEHWQTYEAENGVQGLLLARSTALDCILLDFRLPDMDGLAWMARNTAEVDTAVPVIILTGYENQDTAIEAIRTGADDYLLKQELSPRRLRFAIRRTVEHARARRAAEDALRQANDALESRVADRTAALQAALAEKEVLLKEVHHRVKNNLQVIMSLISLQADMITDPMMVDMFRSTQNSVLAMALVHEQLYGASELASIFLQEYFRLLSTGVLHSYMRPSTRVELLVDVPPDLRLDIDTALPLGLILTELLTNSLKYAFPDGRPGTLSLVASSDGDTLTLLVGDNGIGIVPSRDQPIVTQSLGLQLVRRLVHQIHGAVTHESQAGTHFRITIPLFRKDHSDGNPNYSSR
jgi:two-component sensor histidine kinase